MPVSLLWFSYLYYCRATPCKWDGVPICDVPAFQAGLYKHKVLKNYTILKFVMCQPFRLGCVTTKFLNNRTISNYNVSAFQAGLCDHKAFKQSHNFKL